MLVREAIVEDIITLFKGIKIANGYLTDVDDDRIDHWNVDVYADDITEVINIKDNKVLHEGGKQTLLIDIQIGAIKGSNTYSFMIERIQDVYNCLYRNQSFFKNKYGYFRIQPVEDDPGLERQEKIRAEATIKFEFTYKLSEKWEVDNRVFT